MSCDASFTSRAATADDETFIRALYLGWLNERLRLDQFPDAMRDSLLDLQWRGHRLGLNGNHPKAESSIVESAGSPVGWTLVDRAGDAIHLVEIHVAPTWRSRGLGRAVIAALQREAAAAGRAITLYVHHDNPRAQALYHAMGFIGQRSPPELTPFTPQAVVLPLRWTPLQQR